MPQPVPRLSRSPREVYYEYGAEPRYGERVVYETVPRRRNDEAGQFYSHRKVHEPAHQKFGKNRDLALRSEKNIKPAKGLVRNGSLKIARTFKESQSSAKKTEEQTDHSKEQIHEEDEDKPEE